MAHAFAGAVAPQRDDDALAGGLKIRNVRSHRFEHVAGGLRALGCEVAALARADIDHVAAIRNSEWIEARRGASREQAAPFVLAEVETIGRQRPVRRPS